MSAHASVSTKYFQVMQLHLVLLIWLSCTCGLFRGCQDILNRPFQDNFEGDIDDVIAEIYRGNVADIREVFITSNGQNVAYLDLADNWLFQKYVKDAGMLMQMRPEKLEEGARKAFFINVYNFLTIHAIIAYTQMHGLPESTKSIPNFWTNYCYNIGGLEYSLDDIEHGILRANKGTANHPPLEDSDPRLEVAMTELDQRVHFALNCGGLSCPSIETYNGAGNVTEELDYAKERFLTREVNVKMGDSGMVVELSKILDWYLTDFGKIEREMVEWIKDKVDDLDLKQSLEAALAEDLVVVFKEYDWTLNTM